MMKTTGRNWPNPFSPPDVGPRAAPAAGEERAVCAAQNGDLDAFNRLVLAYQDSLYGWVMALVRDEALAEDVTQSTLITAYEKLNSFRGGSFRSWLFKIARNRSIDLLREARRHPCVSLEEPLSDDAAEGGLTAYLPADGVLPEEAVIQAEQARLLRELLERIPEPYRQVMTLVDLEGFDYHEAAQTLGLPLGTIKSRLTRARLKLRELLERSHLL